MSVPTSEVALKDFLINHDAQYRELVTEHHKYEERLSELTSSLLMSAIIAAIVCALAMFFCGKPLDGSEAPWRVIVADDIRHARWIRGLVSIEISALKP